MAATKRPAVSTASASHVPMLMPLGSWPRSDKDGKLWQAALRKRHSRLRAGKREIKESEKKGFNGTPVDVEKTETGTSIRWLADDGQFSLRPNTTFTSSEPECGS